MKSQPSPPALDQTKKDQELGDSLPSSLKPSSEDRVAPLTQSERADALSNLPPSVIAVEGAKIYRSAHGFAVVRPVPSPVPGHTGYQIIRGGAHPLNTTFYSPTPQATAEALNGLLR
jgi:hypothetical protein